MSSSQHAAAASDAHGGCYASTQNLLRLARFLENKNSVIDNLVRIGGKTMISKC